MNKKMLFLAGWIANVLFLLLIIIMPKIDGMYSFLYFLTMAMIFVIPCLLILLQAGLTIKNNEELDIYNGIPNVGCSLVIMLTFVNFIGSIEKIGRAQIVTILFLFVVIEMMLGYIKITNKNMTKKQFVFVEAASYLSLVLFFLCAMVMSFDFGII